MNVGSILGAELHKRLDAMAKGLGKAKAQLIREAVERMVSNYEKEHDDD